MTTEIRHYLDTIRAYLRLDSSTECEIINELETHIEDELEELKENGLSEKDATNTCLRLLGSAKLVARQIYEAHSQGSWRQTLLASMPHMLFCLFFALNWWTGIGWLLVLLSITAIMTIYGWWHGKPTWLFPWLGYFLLPVMAGGLFLLYLPRGWTWLTIAIYIPLALWLLSLFIRRTIKKDWIYTSLMLFPVPIVVSWFIAIEWGGKSYLYSLEHLNYFAPWIGLSFLALALAVGTFVRLRKRWLKLVSLPITGLITLILVARYAWSRLELPALLGLVLLMFGIFFIPAMLESKPSFPEQSYLPSSPLDSKVSDEKSSHSHG